MGKTPLANGQQWLSVELVIDFTKTNKEKMMGLFSKLFGGTGSVQEDEDASARASLSAKPSLALAEQGDAEAQFYLGGFYRMGLGMPQDLARAAYWSRKAAEQGHVKAQSDMGFIYTYGNGVPQDYTQAMMWYLIAKTGGTTLADQDWKELVALSTPAQVADAQRMAREWWAAHHPTN